MAVGFKCPVQKMTFENSETTYSSPQKYQKIVLEHYFNHTVRHCCMFYGIYVLLSVGIHTDKCIISGLLSVWIRTAVCASLYYTIHTLALALTLILALTLTLILTVTGTFALKNFRSRERKFQVWNFRSRERKCHGTFVPRSESDVELSLPGAKKSWNFRSRERK